MADVRPMTEADVEAVPGVAHAAFSDLSRRMGTPVHPPNPNAAVRVRRCLETTPGGAWVAEEGDRVVGASLGIVREGLWGLSLLVIDPAAQSGGLGRELLARALDAAQGTRSQIILASDDARALRAYQRAGFDLRPVFDADGTVAKAPVRPQTVREGRWPEDRALCDAASRHVRGAAHGDDIGVMVGLGQRFLVHEGGGFAVLRDARVYLLAAQDETVARELLQAALAEGGEAEIDFLDAGQAWAMDVVLDAGLRLRPSGAICVRGEAMRLTPYLPSGAYL